MGALRKVTDQWTWFEDYGYLYATWTVNCPPDRTCQVGMGIMIGGEPRGEKIRFSGAKKITTVLLGAIHIRVVDGQGPCFARVDQGDVGLLETPKIPFP